MPDDRSWPPRCAAEHALQQVRRRLADTPEDTGALFEQASLLDRLGADIEARQAYLDVLSRDMRHPGALRQLASLLVRGGFGAAARTVLEQAVASHPEDAAIRASLGHLLREAGELEAARLQYEAALGRAPWQAEAHQGMSYLLEGVDAAVAERHRRLGFAGRALTTQPYRGRVAPVVVLRLVCASGGNIPTRELLDDRVFLTHTLVAEHAPAGLALPAHGLVLNAIGDAERGAAALDAAERLLRANRVAVINPPARIRPTTRAGNAALLGALEGVVAPRLATVPRASLAAGLPPGFGFPVLLRSPGFHTGEHFLRFETQAALAAGLDALPGAALHVVEPLSSQGADGNWRKYRVMMIDGRLLPVHLAIAAHWKVHHFSTGMDRRPEHRREEAAFLDDMEGTLGATAVAALLRIRDALGLDYGGIDFALAPGGEVLLFEANATMALLAPPPAAIWDYRREAFDAARQAALSMLLHRVQGWALPIDQRHGSIGKGLRPLLGWTAPRHRNVPRFGC